MIKLNEKPQWPIVLCLSCSNVLYKCLSGDFSRNLKPLKICLLFHVARSNDLQFVKDRKKRTSPPVKNYCLCSECLSPIASGISHRFQTLSAFLTNNEREAIAADVLKEKLNSYGRPLTFYAAKKAPPLPKMSIESLQKMESEANLTQIQVVQIVQCLKETFGAQIVEWNFMEHQEDQDKISGDKLDHSA